MMRIVQPRTYPFDAAIRAVDGATNLARLLGCSRRTIYHWREHGVPVDELKRIHELTGVHPAVLRPDYAELFTQ